MQLVDPNRLALFPPARWAGRTAVLEVSGFTGRGGRGLSDAECDRIEADLRGIIVRRVNAPLLRPGPG